MESKIKLLGHAIHPMLIVFPLGLLSIAVLFDVAHMLTGDDLFSQVAFWNIAAGVVGGLAAAIFGFIDWLSVPAGTRARQIGLLHGVGNVVVVGLFALSWVLRLGEPNYVPSALAFVMGLAAVILALVTAWMGGELVQRLRVGVDDGASLNAPSSLSGRSAQAEVAEMHGLHPRE